MRSLAAAAALLLPAALADDGFALTLLKEPGAVCLDGSPGGFYLRPGVASSFGPAFGASTCVRKRLPSLPYRDPSLNPSLQPAARWIIELEGGGWCVSLADCAARAKGDIGSSKGWPARGVPGMDGGANGMLSGDCSVNRFCNATKAHFNYCDGGSFATSADAPSAAPDGTQLYFRGAAIFDASVDALLAAGMAGATDIILKGCSAGGLATFLHADYFVERMRARAPGARVVAMPDACGKLRTARATRRWP